MQSDDANIDEKLLRRAREGDAQAHEVLYRAFAGMVFTVAYRMLGSRAAAEDVVQDSFVEVIRKVPEFRGDGDIRGWIKRIAINKCLSHLRSPWIKRRAVELGEDTEAGNSLIDEAMVGPNDHAGDVGRRQELSRALARISPKARAVVWLHAVEGYTHAEIGHLMGRTASFSKSQLSRAHRELRELLRADELDEESQSCLSALKTV